METIILLLGPHKYFGSRISLHTSIELDAYKICMKEMWKIVNSGGPDTHFICMGIGKFETRMEETRFHSALPRAEPLRSLQRSPP